MYARQLWKIEMRVTIRTEILKPFVVLVLVAALILTSCKPKATHLSQSLENSGVPGQHSTQADEGSTQADGQGTAAAQAPTSVNEPAATSIEPVITQGSSGTLPPVQTPTSPVMILSPTATKKPATTQATTSTPAPTQTRTPTRTVTSTPTRTATLTPSPTLQTGWAGEWTFYVGEGDGPYKSANGNVSLDGLTAEGLFTLDGVAFSFIAGLSEDQLNLNGRYEWGATEGWLNWVMDSNHVQFRGTLDNVYAFCAARVGMPMPEPCGDYVPY